MYAIPTIIIRAGNTFMGSSRDLSGYPYFRGTLHINQELAWVCKCTSGHQVAEFATQCAERQAAGRE